jgi:hypothetical protein
VFGSTSVASVAKLDRLETEIEMSGFLMWHQETTTDFDMVGE